MTSIFLSNGSVDCSINFIRVLMRLKIITLEEFHETADSLCKLDITHPPRMKAHRPR